MWTPPPPNLVVEATCEDTQRNSKSGDLGGDNQRESYNIGKGENQEGLTRIAICYLVLQIPYKTSRVVFCRVITSRDQSLIKLLSGGIAPNQVIARSEFEVHRQIYTE